MAFITSLPKYQHIPIHQEFKSLTKIPRYAQSESLMDEIRSDIQKLPIYSILDSIKKSMNEKPNLLLEAAPGAGKTTIVPLLLSSLGERQLNVIVVEPRRVATRSAAQRMAKLIDQSAGESIGYAIRGESRQSSKTKVTVMTDGILLNKLRDDPELLGVDIVILDEFHERGVGADTALALLREVQMNFRPDLKLVVMSATLLGDSDEESVGGVENAGTKLLRVLGGTESCNVLRSEGRQYPITIQYAKRSSPLHGALLNDPKLLIKTMVDAVEEGLLKAPSKGDVLAFLPGAKEIRKVVQELKFRGHNEIDIFPLYGALPKDEQDRAIYKTESDRRRVIVSSPIAEASLTIQGVTCVVDSGFRREPRYDANTGLPRLVTVPCSRDSVIQRAGRAGRMQDGYCVRLFSEGEFLRLSEHALPEISSTDLVPTTLLLSEWGCTAAKEIMQMPFVDPPPNDSLKKAYQMLVDLEALVEYKVPDSRKKRYRVTEHGQTLVRLPTHPRFATSIVKAAATGKVLLAAAATTAALLDEEIFGRQETNLGIRVKDILQDGPSSTNGRKVVHYASRISDDAKTAVLDAMMGTIPISEVSDNVGRALLPGFVDLIAQHKGDASYGGSTYMLSLGRSARLDSKRDEGDYIIVVDTSTGDDSKTRIRAYSKVELSVLEGIAVEKDELYTVPSKGYEVKARKVTKVGSLVLSSVPLPSPSPDEVTDVLLEAIDSLGGLPALITMQSKKNYAAIVELLQRVRLARQLSSDDDWPSCFASLDAIQDGKGTTEDDELLTSLIEPWLTVAGSVKGLDMLNILLNSLSPDQQKRIDREIPTKIEAPDGSSIPLNYSVGSPPIASGKLQQFFGATESPTIGPPDNTIPVSLSLLSPAGKPLAQTIDLPFFWKETYPSVRAEMRGRYPKHPWPDDPMTATATRLTKKQHAKTAPEDGVKIDKRKERSKQRKKK